MELKKTIINDLKLAMKSGDTVKRDTLRMLDSMIKNCEIEKKKREEGLTDEEVQEVILKAVKQRKDAISQYEIGGRMELAEKEKKEIEILSVFMPSQLSEEEIVVEVEKIISQLESVSASDMGKVMSLTMGKLRGKADGQMVKKIVEEKLS